MLLTRLFLCVLLACRSQESADFSPEDFTPPKEDKFYVLESENAGKIIFQDRVMTILYLKGDDCPKSKKAKENLSRLISEFWVPYPTDPNFFLLYCDKNQELCKSRLKNRSIPSLDFRVDQKDSIYIGDFSQHSLEEFLKPRLTDRIKKYSHVEFLKLKGVQKKEQNVIAILKNRGDQIADRFFKNLMRFEESDSFLECDGKTDCLLHFDKNPEASAILLLNERKLFLSFNSGSSFAAIVNSFNEFKNPLFILFGIEFEKKVMKDLNPTFIFIVDNEKEETQKAVQSFDQVVKKNGKQFYACLIKKHELSNKRATLFQNFMEEIGIEGATFPLLLMLEPEMETLRMQKFVFSSQNFTNDSIQTFIEKWMRRQLTPVPKNEINLQTEIDGFKVITNQNFKEKVFVKGQESIVLVHNGFEKCQKSKVYLKIMKTLAKENDFKDLNFLLINAKKNDLPIFVAQFPSFLIFTDDLWEYPISFDKSESTFMDVAKVLRQRKKLIKAFKVEDEMTGSLIDDL